MSCPACTAARTYAHSGLYRAGCQGCTVRGLAKGLGFFKSQREGTLTRDYRNALHSIFKGDVAGGHELVKAEAKRLKEMK